MNAMLAEHKPHIVIIGGGITGLSAAHALDASAATVDYTLVERTNRLGGKIQTEIIECNGRYVVEAGPDSLLTQKPAGPALARAVGLGKRLIGNNQQRKTVAILSHGRLAAMPEGLNLVVPLKPWPFLQANILSLGGRLRALLEPLVPARVSQADESLADCIRRRFGQEMLERMAEPLLSGIHNADSGQQSIQATFPRFHSAEREYGSVTRGLRASKRKQAAPIGSAFASFPNGLQELVDALAGSVRGAVRTNTATVALQYAAVTNTYQVALANGELLTADAVILTTPAANAAELLAPMQPDLAAALRQLRTVSTGIVTLAFDATDAAQITGLTGVLVPRVERRRINAITVASTKWADRAPDGSVLLRVFVGGARHAAMLALDDPALVQVVRDELRELVGISAMPHFAHVTRWVDANPQYNVGHNERIAALDALCPATLVLVGCAYRGVGIPDCIAQGQAAAERVLAAVGKGEGVTG